MVSVFKTTNALKMLLLVTLILCIFILILVLFNKQVKMTMACTEPCPTKPTSESIGQPTPIKRPFLLNVKPMISKRIECSDQDDELKRPVPSPLNELKSLQPSNGDQAKDGQESKAKSRLNNEDLKAKREVIKEMMRHAWCNYVKYAWGANELSPLSKTGHWPSFLGPSKLGATIVDALDTLFIMDLTDEFNSGREWVAKNLNWDHIFDSVSVFEVNIRFVGGLLSIYALTKDTIFLKKAEHIANKLLPAFQTKSGIPKSRVSLNTKSLTDHFWLPSGSSNLAEVGSLHLEFVYLAHETYNPIFKHKVHKIRDVIHKAKPDDGLYPNFIDITTGKWTVKHISFGAYGDSFYEYLLKAWIQSNGKDKEAKDMFFDTMKAAKTKLLQKSKNGLIYLAEMKYNSLIHEMSHLACFTGGLFALGSQETTGKEREEFLNIGEELAKTCHESYIRSTTRLGPERFVFTDFNETKSVSNNANYILRPEVVETYFYLWRITKDQKYRDWAWDVVVALQKHCRVENGFSGISNVYVENSYKDDVQQSFFLAETLKYLYLIFADDLLPLQQWVFNTEGHPLPIRDRNDAYCAKTNSEDSHLDVHYF